MPPKSGYRQCATCGKNRATRFFTGQRGRVCVSCRRTRSRANSRNKRIFDSYGLTAEEYAFLLAAQLGRCAICRGERRYNPDVDHDHASGLIRGLLCRRCNRELLPAARDDAAVLRAAADYLENPPAFAAIGKRRVLNAHVKEEVER